MNIKTYGSLCITKKRWAMAIGSMRLSRYNINLCNNYQSKLLNNQFYLLNVIFFWVKHYGRK